MESKSPVLEKEIVLTDYECDLNRRVTPGSLLRLTQQISTDHCDSWGVTAERYAKTGTAFLMAKVSLRLKPRSMSSCRMASETPMWYLMRRRAQALSVP